MGIWDIYGSTTQFYNASLRTQFEGFSEAPDDFEAIEAAQGSAIQTWSKSARIDEFDADFDGSWHRKSGEFHGEMANWANGNADFPLDPMSQRLKGTQLEHGC